MTPILKALAELEDAAKAADRMVCDLASGKHKWNMCVPPQDTDTDMVLIKPIRGVRPACSVDDPGTEVPCYCDEWNPVNIAREVLAETKETP